MTTDQRDLRIEVDLVTGEAGEVIWGNVKRGMLVTAMPNPDGGIANTLVAGGMPAVQTRRLSKFAHTRMLTGQHREIVAASALRTYHLVSTVEQGVEYDQAQLIFVNGMSSPFTVASFAIAATSGTSDVTPTQPWAVGGAVEVAARHSDGVNRAVLSPWLDVQSVPMSNGSLRRLMMRATINVNGVSVTGLTSVLNDTPAKWDSGGRYLRSYFEAGDFSSTNQAAFVGATSSGSAIFGWRLRCRAKVLTVCGVGPSTTQGSGQTNRNLDSWGFKMCQSASLAGAPVEWLNWGVGEQTSTQYLARFRYLLESGIVPGVAIFQAATSNDGTPSAATVATARKNVAEFIALCEAYGVFPVVTTRNPNTALAYDATATSIALAHNAEVMAMRAGGLEVWDICSPLTASSETMLYAAEYTTDGTHPNGAGHARLAELYMPRLRMIAGL